MDLSRESEIRGAVAYLKEARKKVRSGEQGNLDRLLLDAVARTQITILECFAELLARDTKEHDPK